MVHEQVAGKQSPGTGLYPVTPVLLKGRWLAIAHVTWLLLAMLSIVLFSASVPFHYRQLLELCESECASWQISSSEALALQNMGVSLQTYAAYAVGLAIVWALVYTAVAAIIFWQRSQEWMALLAALWLVTFGTMAFSTQALSEGQPILGPLILFLDQLGWVVLLPLFLLTFPDGRFVPRWTRLLLIGFFLFGLVGSASELFLPIEHFFPHLAQYEFVPRVFWFSMVFIGIGSQVYRYRRFSDAAQRQQTKWIVFGWVAAALGLAIWALLLEDPFSQAGRPALLGNLIEMTLVTSIFVLVGLTIGFSILRYRLWDIDLIINRALIWSTLTGLVLGTYILVVGILGSLFQSPGSLLPSMIATGVIALLFQPLRQRVQRGVNRLLYGERDEPYSVLSRLGRRLEATLAAEAVLPTVVETVAHTLKLPYVAIILKEGDGFRIAAATGEPVKAPLALPLTYQGENLGQLICGPRSDGELFTGEERRLLEDISSQAGVALHAVLLNADLQRSRERLVVAREEERRRIRRDLHDGLGPVLASQTLKIGTARALLRQDPELAEALLRQIEKENTTALEDIRRLVYNLRPPALDELGLLRAIQQDAPRHPGLFVLFELPSEIPKLSAAVEVAIYRIVQEALANVVRHAGATSVSVHLETDRELRLRITDDGRGVPGIHRTGVGLRSMRERAEELGGSFRFYSRPAAGTTIEVTLPLREVEV